MSKCCENSDSEAPRGDAPCKAFEWFEDMVSHCIEYAGAAKAAGRPIVGIMCEYTPRELVLAAGGITACLCGGSAEMVGPAEDDLPANLCPLIKSTYGYHTQKANPFLEMADLIVAETTCDGKKKMYELMGRTCRMHVLELPQKPYAREAMEHWKAEMRKLKEALEELFSVEITDAKLREAITLMNRQRSLKRRLAELMQSDAPPLTGRLLLDFQSIIACIPGALDHYAEALQQLTGKPGPAEYADRVRVMMTGVPVPHGAHRVLDIIENSGGLVVAMENCSGIKPIYEDVDDQGDDPLSAIAEKYFHLPCSVMTPNDSRMELLAELAGDYRPDCIIELIWQACLTYDVESARVRNLAVALGIPYLRIETDYSPSDSARIAVRVEALFETVRSRKGGSNA
ncbi:MAG: double-cubane-cluster-containing anaerobic reductase [Phycisphaerae bacterium]|jgi:benzoyl-CoA reductase/2-hydroxyglutaryl-CoA dehydratase subunit BcrC/BadD/HgdB|nr:double-cubane-cluster-containing anaerobic reductase [Phycisphaerae bacterium]